MLAELHIDNFAIIHKEREIVAFDFDDVEGNKIIDLSGNNHHGIIKRLK